MVSGAPCRIPPHLLLLFPFDHPPPLHRRREPFSSSSAAFSIVCLRPRSCPSLRWRADGDPSRFSLLGLALFAPRRRRRRRFPHKKMLREIIRSRCSSGGNILPTSPMGAATQIPVRACLPLPPSLLFSHSLSFFPPSLFFYPGYPGEERTHIRNLIAASLRSHA